MHAHRHVGVYGIYVADDKVLDATHAAIRPNSITGTPVKVSC